MYRFEDDQRLGAAALTPATRPVPARAPRFDLSGADQAPDPLAPFALLGDEPTRDGCPFGLSARLHAWWHRLWLSPRDAYVMQARDLAELEQRMRSWETMTHLDGLRRW